MELRGVQSVPYRLPLRRPWRSAAGTFTERRGFLITVESEDGERGYGDCAPLPDAGSETLAQAGDWLTQHSPAFTGRSVTQALAMLPALDGRLPATRCGLETALLDLAARREQQALYRWLEPAAVATVRVNANLGSLDTGSETRLAGAAGFAVVKLKVGLASPEQETGQLHRLAKRLPEGTQLRLDANRAWDFEQARQFIQDIATLPVESLEEPLAGFSFTRLAELQAMSSFPLALDESLAGMDTESLIDQKPVARLVLKPMLLGGLQATLAVARKARQADIETLVTTTVDSAVGSWAASHLAAAVDAGKPGPAHGLATSAWLLKDLAPAPRIRDGSIRLPDNPGLGVQPGN